MIHRNIIIYLFFSYCNRFSSKYRKMTKVIDVDNTEDKNYCTICLSDLKESFKHLKDNFTNRFCRCCKCSNKKSNISGKI
jgi:hypothetical protein